MRILIVEDDHKIATALKRGLSRQSYAVDLAFDGDEGMNLATNEPYDLIVLDRMLPGNYDGLAILKELRTNNNHVPVLLLTARDKVLDRVEGLNAGADDYMVKPFAFLEFMARVRALLRRPKETLTSVIEYDNVSLDSENFVVKRNDQIIKLTALEFSLLEFLMRNKDRIVTKDQIIGNVWNYDANVLPNTVEVYISYLRNKIDKAFTDHPSLIHTRRGFGYFFGIEK